MTYDSPNAFVRSVCCDKAIPRGWRQSVKKVKANKYNQEGKKYQQQPKKKKELQLMP
jgi:hypothetical protein